MIYQPNRWRIAAARLSCCAILSLVLSGLEAGEPSVLMGHTDAVYDVEFSPDGELLASGSYDDSVKLWRVSDGKLVATLNGHSDQVFRVAFSPDGKQLASCSGDSTAVIWDLDRLVKKSTLAGHGDPMIDVTYASDGNSLATAGSHIQYWIGEKEAWSTPHSELYFSVDLSPDRSQIACGTRNLIHLIDVDQGKPKIELVAGPGMVYQVQYSPDGTRLAWACSDGTVTLWDVADRKKIASVKADAYALFDMSFSRDGRQLVTGGRERVIRTWSVPGLKPLAEQYGPDETILAVSFSPDGNYLACGSYDGLIHMWRLTE